MRDFINPNGGAGGPDPKALVEWQPPVGPIASALYRFEEVHELIRGHRVDLLRTFQARRR